MFRHILTAIATVFGRRAPKPEPTVMPLSRPAPVTRRGPRTIQPSASLIAHRRWRKTRKRIERESRRRNRE